MQQWREQLFSTKRYDRDGLPAAIHLARPLLQLHKRCRGTATFTSIGYYTCMDHPTDLAYPTLYYRFPRLILIEYFYSFLYSSIFAIDSSLRSNHIVSSCILFFLQSMQ